MDVVCEEEEEVHVLSLVRPEVPSLPPSPLAAYTPLQWALLSRYPHLVENALSTRRNKSRSAHVQFIASRYSKEVNPNFHPPTPRKTSPLAASPPMTLAPRRLTNVLCKLNASFEPRKQPMPLHLAGLTIRPVPPSILVPMDQIPCVAMPFY